MKRAQVFIQVIGRRCDEGIAKLNSRVNNRKEVFIFHYDMYVVASWGR